MDTLDTGELLSQAAYARRINRSRQWVNKLVREKKLPLHGGRIYPLEADRLLEQMADAAYDHNRKGGLPFTLTQPAPSDEDSQTSMPSDDPPDKNLVTTDEEGVDQIFEHLKKLIFDGRSMQDVPHVEIKKLNDFIGAVQRKLEIQTQARTLIPIEEAQTTFVEVAGRVREGLLNVADQIAGALSAKALELLRGHLPPESQPVLDQLMQGKQWEDLFHRTINHEMSEVLRALSDTPRLVRQD